MKKPTVSLELGSEGLARVLASLRRARNQLRKVLTHSNTLSGPARQMLWKEERSLDEQCIAFARRVVSAQQHENDLPHTKRKAA